MAARAYVFLGGGGGAQRFVHQGEYATSGLYRIAPATLISEFGAEIRIDCRSAEGRGVVSPVAEVVTQNTMFTDQPNQFESSPNTGARVTGEYDFALSRQNVVAVDPAGLAGAPARFVSIDPNPASGTARPAPGGRNVRGGDVRAAVGWPRLSGADRARRTVFRRVEGRGHVRSCAARAHEVGSS